MTDTPAPTTPTDEERATFKRQELEAAKAIMAGDRYCPDPSAHEATPAETLDVSPEALRSRAKDIRDEFRADEAESGLDAALAHIALALAQAEARLPFESETERIVRQTLAIVDQTTPLSVGEPLVQLILARLRSLQSDR